MMIIPNSTLIDTHVDTLKFYVTMTFNFNLRRLINKNGLSPLYLDVSDGRGNRQRINLDLRIKPEHWDKQSKSIVGPKEEVYDNQLIFNDSKAKVNNIKLAYRLNNKTLTLDSFLEEWENEMPRGNFVAFAIKALEDRRPTIKYPTFKKERAVIHKLKKHKPNLAFDEISIGFFENYRNHLAKLGNGKVTRNNNIKIIKQYLRYAENLGIRLPIKIESIYGGSTNGNRTYMRRSDIKRCYDYYFSSFICESHSICLGYFLFSCFTGLRFSDLMNQQRSELLTGEFQFKHVKTGKPQIVRLNKKATGILKNQPNLFIKKFSNDHVRTTVKDICKFLGITQDVNFHMARHTFATTYILMGGKTSKLKILLNHSSLKQTEGYLHMAEMERNAEADLLDNVF